MMTGPYTRHRRGCRNNLLDPGRGIRPVAATDGRVNEGRAGVPAPQLGGTPLSAPPVATVESFAAPPVPASSTPPSRFPPPVEPVGTNDNASIITEFVPTHV